MLDRLSNGTIQIRGTGTGGQTYTLEATSNLDNPVWTAVGNSSADGNGRFTFFPAQMPSAPARFFRAVTSTP